MTSTHRQKVPVGGRRTGGRWVVLAGFLLAGSIAWACPIPVFQYALENWETDPFVVTVYHEGAVTGDDLEALELLRKAAGVEGSDPQANLEVHTVDLAEGGERPGEMETLPWMMVRYPQTRPIPVPVWAGALDLATARNLLDSPARAKMGKLLLDRKTAVWVLLESGDGRQDDALAETLRKELDRLEETLVPPSDTALWGGEEVKIDTNISFDILRVSREDPAEALFIRMLMRSEPDLADDRFAGQPMVFPVYGRGLIMYALIGRGINRWTISEAGEFITGPCSCQIKSANPGVDILMSVQWSKHIVPMAPGSVAPVGVGGFLDRMDTAEEQLGGDGEEGDRPQNGQATETE